MKETSENSELLYCNSMNNILERIQRIQEKVNIYKPIAEEEIKSMTSQEFRKKVCNGPLNYVNAKEGNFLYQCSFQNLRIFDQINSGFTPKEHPSIDVCVVSEIKFVVNCPFSKSEICKLKCYRKSYKENSAKNL